MSFFCPHFDIEKDYCLALEADCVPGRPGCVLRNNSVFYIPAEERLKERKAASVGLASSDPAHHEEARCGGGDLEGGAAGGRGNSRQEHRALDTPMNHNSIQQYYGDDHDRLDGLFREYQSGKAADPVGAIRAFEEFKAGLERHIVWEEEILFPAFESKTGRVDGPTAVMRSEHRQIRGFLAAIAEKLARNDVRTEHEEAGLLSVLGPHNQKEESILYPMIDRLTPAEERAEVFAAMAAYAGKT
ncbi:MAG: iron-sulfur cluster repair di-iron protein [Verrucomicrobia bacterium ADurb.Bin006]|jgi:hemerythrin-like domain-containing protein|nr:MAG: iron-sulfur cluster repair di-iron protein [Verrucomicrobia bacterium ADurb.Bin006]